MVRIRLQRFGRTNRPFYRILVMDSRSRRDGAAIEQVGWYDPLARDAAKQIRLDPERIRYWLGVGARPSDTVRDILARHGLVDRQAWEAERARQRALAAVRAASAPAAPAAEGRSAS